MLTDTTERSVTLRDGTLIHLRPVRPDDDEALVALFGRLSDRTIYQRFFTVRRSLPPSWLRLLTQVDERHMGIVAERPTYDGPVIVGVARYDVAGPDDTAEIALLARETDILARAASQGVTEAVVRARR
jgi:acetyltransferase